MRNKTSAPRLMTFPNCKISVEAEIYAKLSNAFETLQKTIHENWSLLKD